MAGRTNMGKTSTTCKVCNRTVRYDSPTFPYCNYHVNLKHNRTKFHTDGTEQSMEEIRNTLYNPQRSYVGQNMETVLLMQEHNPSFDMNTMINVYRNWQKAIRNIDIMNPSEVYANRDRIIEAVISPLSKKYEVEILKCNSGEIIIPDEGKKTTKPHRVIMVKMKNDNNVIIDPATSAPLYGIVDDVSKHFHSGDSTVGDGLYISSLFEYGAYSTISYSNIVSENTNEVLWHNNDILKDSDVEAQRRLIATIGYDERTAPKPIYLSSATDWAKKEGNKLISQEEPVKNEPQSIDDILGF